MLQLWDINLFDSVHVIIFLLIKWKSDLIYKNRYMKKGI